MRPLDAIAVFIAVLDEGSVQGAALQLGISRPTVRKRLEELEAEVGVPLLYRMDGVFHATPAGRVYARRTREMLDELDILARSARSVSAVPRGRLRIGFPTGTPPALLADLSEVVRSRLPDVRLELLTSALPRDELLRSVDCLFSLDIDEPRGPFVSFDLGIVREQLVASPSYLDRHPAIEHLDDLAGHALCAWIAPDTGVPERLPVCRGVAPTHHFAVCTDDPLALMWMAARGQGLALLPYLPELATPPFFEGGPLRTVLTDCVGRDRKRRLLVSEAVADLPVVRSFLEATRAAAQSL